MRVRFHPMLVLATLCSALALALGPPGCGGPRSLQALETMNEQDYAGWLVRVRAWSVAAGYTLVDQHAVAAGDVLNFASALRALSGEPSAPIDLAELAKKAGLNGPVLIAVVMEGQALIEKRGGWPGGARRDELVAVIAAGVQEGAVQARDGPALPH